MKLLWESIKRGLRQLVSRKIYLTMMLIVPVASTFFFVDLMNEGLPMKTPSAVVDEDQSSMSRKIVRTLGSSQYIDINYKLESFHDAIDKVRSGEIFGFFLIPADFEKETVAGRSPTLSYYSNMTYYVPGTLSFKGFKTTAVTVTGGVVTATLVSMGMPQEMTGALLQPVAVQDHPLGNPWMNYSIYLSNSFIPGVLALLVLLVTVFSIAEEMKRGTSVEWLRSSGGSITVALAGKLLPQTVIFTIVGLLMQAVLYGFCGFPLNNHPAHMWLAVFMLVIASQAFALTIVELVPNLRLALSIVSLTGILSFSIVGFSFPVQSMYGGVGIFSYIIPLRYYFLIYVDQALNGIPIYYSRYYYIALAVFPLVALIGLRRLRRHCLNPVYVP